MFGLEHVYKVFSQLDTPPIGCFSGQCSKVRYKKAKCRLCFEYCPVDAIIFDGGIKIDFSKCTGCGICANVCRNGVFEIKDIDDKKLLLNIKRILRDQNEIEFVCAKRDQPKELFPNVVSLLCLGRLSDYVLISSVLEGAETIWLDDNKCNSCSSGKTQKLIHQNINTTKRFLKIWDIKGEIILISHFPSQRNNEAMRSSYTYNKNGDSISRREFFTKLQEKTLETAMNLIDDNEATANPYIKTQFYAKISEKRELLLELVSKMDIFLSDRIFARGFPFSKIEVIDERCNFCRLCVLLCPTGAMEYSEEGVDVCLRFNLRKCVKCGLCQQVCANKAILFLPYLNPKDILGLESCEVVRSTQIKCKKCDKLFLPLNDNSDFCQRCGSECEIEESFFEMIGLEGRRL